jgi:hypothetical protein
MRPRVYGPLVATKTPSANAAPHRFSFGEPEAVLLSQSPQISGAVASRSQTKLR